VKGIRLCADTPEEAERLANAYPGLAEPGN